MDFTFRFENYIIFFFLIPIIILLAIYKYKFYKHVTYKHTLVSFFSRKNLNASNIYKKIFFLLRCFLLVLLIFLIAKPQFVNTKSKVKIEGIDIILALDVSDSMRIFDDKNDTLNRLEIAKKEAIRFINKRENDAIGLVIFALDALTKCPLTIDKKVLTQFINEIKIGDVNERATCIAKAIVTAANRLKDSKAKSKIIILLTDGAPTIEFDFPMNESLTLAKKLGIKIYSIGIGNDSHGFVDYNGMRVPHPSIFNKELLTYIAQQTSGKFFYSKSQSDMKNIYDTIDKLEKTKIETNIFNNYYDFFIPLILLAIFIFFTEQVLATYIWFHL